MNNKKYFLNRKELKNILEPFLFKELDKDKYVGEVIKSRQLLTWNRLDLGFKLFYLYMKDKNNELAEQVYSYDIKTQTSGKFREFGNDNKDSLQKYILEFKNIFDSIKKYGFDKHKTIIPLSANNSIRNGAHRVASAAYMNQDIDCVYLNNNDFIIDYNYYYERNVPEEILDIAVDKFIEYANNIYVAFLWPSGQSFQKETELKFKNIVYKKDIKLTVNGGFNLLTELYKHMKWVGDIENGFAGIKQKLIECFPNFDEVTVVVFQAKNINEVRLIKEEVRKICNLGFSSVHITDTKEEAIRISKLIFNENGLHFLNNATPYKYLTLFKELENFENFISLNNIFHDKILIDGSVTLNLYGIRESYDIDYLICDNKLLTENNSIYDSHDSELKYHNIDKKDLIYNPKYYFQYGGFKFISFYQLFKMKQRRNEQKDINDCQLMIAFMENNNLKKIIPKIKQNLFYMKIKTGRNLNIFKIYLLKKTHLYESLRSLKHKTKELMK